MQVGGTAVASAAGELEQRARAGEMEITPALLVKLQEALEPFMKSAQDWLVEVKETK